jgi:hypothetical protein
MFEFIKPTSKTKLILEMIYKQILYAPHIKTIWLSKTQWDAVMATLNKEQREMWGEGITHKGYVLKTRVFD